MTLVVEDGTIVADANSFVTVAEVDARAAELATAEAAAWIAESDTTKKENAIIVGTEWFGDTLYTRWRGARTSEEQTLDYPREGVVTPDGRAIASDQIPAELKRANCDISIESLSDPTLTPDVPAKQVGVTQMRRKSSSGAEEEYHYEGGTTVAGTSYRKIVRGLRPLLKPWPVGGGWVERGH
jgi:hypothetical protein